MQKETNSEYNNSNSATWKPFLQLFQYSKTYKCILSSFAHPSKLLQQPVHGRDEKNFKKKKRLHILWVLLNRDMYSLTKAITCLSLAGFQSGSNKTSRFPPIKLRPQPPALLLKRNANSSYKMFQLQLFIIISSDRKRNTKIN